MNKLYNTVEVLSYLGAIANDTSILNDKKNRLNPNKDLELNRLHRIIYCAIENIAANSNVKEVDETVIDIYLSTYPDQHGYYINNKGNELIQTIKSKTVNVPVEYMIKTIKKLTLLREYEKIGFETKFIYDPELVDPVEISKQREQFDRLTVTDIRNMAKLKMDLVHENMQIDSGEVLSFQAGEGILELIESCKTEPTWGYSFQSKLMNAVFRGALGKKLLIRSGGSGTGKSRMSLGDLCSIAATEMFDTDKCEWIKNPRAASGCFITTELDKSECQLILISILSGVPEEIVKNGDYTTEVEERILKASQVLKESQIYIEYISDFSITDLESIIERNVHRHDVSFVFFDYIQITPSFAREVRRTFGYDLREDQMLNLQSTLLKNLANKLNIFILTGTQLNRSYKTDDYPDATHLRGGAATLDKADGGIITMKVTQKDKIKLTQLMNSEGMDNSLMPTHGHHIIKNRGAKWTSVILWVNMNLDNMKIVDCFATTQDFEQVYIEPVVL